MAYILPQSDEQHNPPQGRMQVFRPTYADDGTLWNAFRAGDEQALVAMFDQYVNPLYRYGCKFLKEGEGVQDAIQELFIELWKSRTNLGETTSIKFYLFKSLRRKLFRIKTNQEKITWVSLANADELASLHAAESEAVQEQWDTDQKKKVEALMGQLTKRQQEAIFLRYFEEMEYERIAGIMEISKQAVYNIIHKAIDSLKEKISAQ